MGVKRARQFTWKSVQDSGQWGGHLPGAPLRERGGLSNRVLHVKKTRGRSWCESRASAGRAVLGLLPTQPWQPLLRAQKCFQTPEAKNPTRLT